MRNKKNIRKYPTGGLVEEDKFLKNWFKNRKISDPYINEALNLDRKDLLNRISQPYSVNKVDEVDKNVQGRYENNTISLNKNADKDTALHENTHRILDQDLYTRTTNRDVVKQLIRPKNKLTGDYNEKYDYFSNSDEVIPRLMNLRRKMKVNPKEIITPEHIDRFMKTYKGDSNNINDLRELFDSRSIVDLLNLTTSNGTNKNNYMELGGVVNTYDTQLTPEELEGYNAFAQIYAKAKRVKIENLTRDYDLQGYYKKHNGVDLPKVITPELHLNDEFKKPNHITFSNGSIYSTPETPGGQWKNEKEDETGAWSFIPTEHNLKNTPINKLQEYFNTYEKGNKLILPNMKKKFALGGNTNSTIEAEGGEVIETPQGQVGNINGPSHASGGVTMNVPDGSLIFSDRIGIKNNKGKFLSLADRKKIREATLKKLNKRQRDPFQLNTLQRTGERLAKEEEADVTLQTMIRKQVEGDQNNDIPKAALGTGDKLTAAANVGSSLFNVYSTLSAIGDTKPALRMNSNLNKDYGIAGLKNLDNVSDNLKIQNTYAENQIKNQLTQNKQDATAAIDNAGGSLNLRRALRSDLATKTNKIYSDSMTDLSSALAAKEGELGVTKSNMLNVRDDKVAEGEAKKLDFNSNAQRYDQAVARSNSQSSSAAGQSVFGAVQSIGSALNTDKKNEQTLGLYNKILGQSTGGSGLTVPGFSESTSGSGLSIPGLSEDPNTYTSIFPSAYKFPYGGTTGKQPKGSIQPFIKKGPTPDKNDMSATFNKLLSMIQPNNDSFKLPTQKKKSVSISSNDDDDNEIISTDITKSPDYSSIRKRKRTRTTASVKDNSGDVLDLIARGESSNNYNAISNSTPLSGLSNMTLQDVMTHAKRTGKHVGAWQFGHNEIETTAKKLGLDLKKTKYSPAIQRQLAKQLALDHGLGDLKTGKTSREKAIYRLSKKWAALPKDESGKSYYEGKGTNKANINFDELYTTLGSNG